MICSSLNLLRFILVRLLGVGLYQQSVTFQGSTSSRTATPPSAPVDGACWLVDSGPSGAWTGHAGSIAAFNAGEWTFVPPRNGMSVLVVSNGQILHYRNGWQTAAQVAAPTGGTVIDTEARAAINSIRAALATAGVLPQS